jgi:hypothetical protein
MNNEDFPALPRNQDSESSPDRVTMPSESTWNTPRQPQGILEAFSSPANPARSSSESYSRLDNLRRVNITYRTRHLTPIPTGETTIELLARHLPKAGTHSVAHRMARA